MGKPRKIAQYTLDGEFMRVWDSPKEAAEYLGIVNSGNLVRCCKGRKAHAYCYRWLYAEDMCRANEIFASNPVKRKTDYTEEKIIEKSKEFSTRTEMWEKAHPYYDAARRRGILDKLQIERRINPYNGKLYYVYAYEFKETHSVYVGVTFRKERGNEHNGKNKEKSKKSAVFNHAVKNGLSVPDPIQLECNLDPDEALIKEDYYRECYREQGWNILNRAKTGPCSGSLGGTKRIPDKRIYDTAAKFEYVRDFEKAHNSLYAIAQQRGILKDVIAKTGMKYRQAPNGTYSEENCYNIAMECGSIKELRERSKTLYKVVYDNGWIEQYWWLSNGNRHEVIACNGSKLRIFRMARNAAEWFGCTRDTLRYRMKHGLKIEGYSVRYFEDIG